MNLRKFWIIVHRYVGLATAAFLVVSGLTGSILAFEGEYDRLMHSSLWRVEPEASRLNEQDLFDRVEHEMTSPGSRETVEQIQIIGDRTAQVFSLTDGRQVYVNPYNGSILGTRERGPSTSEKFFYSVRQLHVRLLAGNVGRWVVDIATGALLLLVPTGIYLWWKKKRASLNLKASWPQINWDLHNVLGLYGFVVMLLLASTGLLIEFEAPLYWVSGSNPQHVEAIPRSTVPEGAAGTFRVPNLDEFMLAAEKAVPGSQVNQIQLPMRPRSPVRLQTRRLGTDRHNTVFLDRYDGHVLRVDNANRQTSAFRAHSVNQAIHMGTLWGLPSRIMMSLSSLVVVVSVVTGFAIWWRKKAA
jgi:uncharacterized iron-regulated membrane protein